MTDLRHEPRQNCKDGTTIETVDITDEMLEVVQQYVDRKITRARAAAALSLSERQVTRICEELGLERVKSQRATEEEEASKRRVVKEQAARAALAGQITPQQAALRAGCHQRTILRMIERLRAQKKKR